MARNRSEKEIDPKVFQEQFRAMLELFLRKLSVTGSDWFTLPEPKEEASGTKSV